MEQVPTEGGRIALILGSNEEALRFFKKASQIAQSNGLNDIYVKAICEIFLIELNKGVIKRQTQLFDQIKKLEVKGEIKPDTKAFVLLRRRNILLSK